jgi:hypothetical protein
LNNTGEKPMNKLNLNFYHDAGHGWLAVPHGIIRELKITDISACSYRDHRYAYLEEDRDAGIFVQACKDHNIEFGVTEVSHGSYSRIRDMNHYC